jgi:hypothetical protein
MFVLMPLLVIASPRAPRKRGLNRDQWVQTIRGLRDGTCVADPIVAKEILRTLDRREQRRGKPLSGNALPVAVAAYMVFLGYRHMHYHHVGPAVAAFLVAAVDLVQLAGRPVRRREIDEMAEASGVAAQAVLQPA